MTPDAAEASALSVLAWLAGHDDILPVFLGSSGAGLEDLRTRAAEPEFLASVMDFVLMDDVWVLEAAEACAWPPDRMVEIRAALPGGAFPNWT